jgi:hypothetical protein
MPEGCYLSALDTGRRWCVSLKSIEAESDESPLYHYDFAEAEAVSEGAIAVTAKARSPDGHTRLLELDDVSLAAPKALSIRCVHNVELFRLAIATTDSRAPHNLFP